MLVLTGCSDDAEVPPVPLTPLQESVESVAVSVGANGVELAEPDPSAVRYTEGVLSRATLKHLGVLDHPGDSINRTVANLVKREAESYSGDPSFAMLLAELSLLAEEDATVGRTVARSAEAIYRDQVEERPTQRSLEARQIALIALNELQFDGVLPCGGFASPGPAALVSSLDHLSFNPCAGADPFPYRGTSWPGDDIPTTPQLLNLVATSEGDLASVGASLSPLAERIDAPPHLFALVAISCGDCLPDHGIAALRLSAETYGSASRRVESFGFFAFAQNALITLLDYPQGSALADPQPRLVDGWDRAIETEGPSSAMMRWLHFDAPEDSSFQSLLVDQAQSERLGMASAMSARFGSCEPIRDHAREMNRTISEIQGQMTLDPLMRVGIALDVRQLDVCDELTAPAPDPRAFRPAVSAKDMDQPGGLHEAWASTRATCLLTSRPPLFGFRQYAKLARSYIDDLDGPGFGLKFRVFDLLAAKNLLAIEEGGCEAGLDWWEAP